MMENPIYYTKLGYPMSPTSCEFKPLFLLILAVIWIVLDITDSQAHSGGKAISAREEVTT